MGNLTSRENGGNGSQGSNNSHDSGDVRERPSKRLKVSSDAISNDTNEENKKNDVTNNENYNNEDGGEDIIDHDRLRSISNYYFESMVGLPVHARAMRAARLADSSCAEELSAEARQERYKMVSWMEDDDLLEEAGLNLDWGEYYIADDEMGSDDDESDVSSCEEAEEINDEEVDRECDKATAACLGSKEISAAVANFDNWILKCPFSSFSDGYA